MGMNQANPDFNDALETYFPAARLAALAGRGIAVLERCRVALLGGRRSCNERIVEYPMVFRLLPDRGKVLDVGCTSSRLPLQLASLGYEVHGVDLRPYPLAHPNFTFHQVDLLAADCPFPPSSFDIVTAVSCIEHFGLGAYGDSPEQGGDLRFMAALRNLLRPGGTLILTVPYGRGGVTPKHRIYDATTLAHLVTGFTRAEERYFRRVDGAWRPATAAELADVASPTLPVNGVVTLAAVRPE